MIIGRRTALFTPRTLNSQYTGPIRRGPGGSRTSGGDPCYDRREPELRSESDETKMVTSDGPAVLFEDRTEAGLRLARALDLYADRGVLVLGIPRGGVLVAAETARNLNADLDILVARKIGAPGSPELAIGAVTASGGRFLNDDLIAELGVSPEYIEEHTATETAEATDRDRRLRGDADPIEIDGRVVLLIDDGLATGATMRAAIRSVRWHRPEKLVVAVPVAARETCAIIREEADELLCLSMPEPFYAVGPHYARFDQVQDAEVIETLQEARAARSSSSGR